MDIPFPDSGVRAGGGAGQRAADGPPLSAPSAAAASLPAAAASRAFFARTAIASEAFLPFRRPIPG
jgi:hypothetical protein